MTMVNTSTTPYSANYNNAISNYSTGLSVINQSGTTSGTSSNGTAAFALGGNLSLLNQLNTASGDTTLQTLQNLDSSNSTAINGTLPSISSYITNSPLGLQLLANMNASEFGYLNNSSTAQSTSSATATNTDQFNPANPFGDAIQSQMGDSQLYSMDPALLAIAQASTAAYTQSQQSTTSAGSTVDTSA